MAKGGEIANKECHRKNRQSQDSMYCKSAPNIILVQIDQLRDLDMNYSKR